MDSGLPSPARVTFSLLNGYSVAINLGTIVTASPGVFRLYTRCATGWCYVTSFTDANGAVTPVVSSVSVATTCVSAAAAPLGIGNATVLYSNATVASVTTPTTGAMWSLYGQYRDESCRAILRVALNWPGQPTRSLWVRQVRYASSLPWGIGPSAGIVVSVRNGFSHTIDMGYYEPGAPVMFKLFYLVNSVWTEPTDYTLLSGNCLPALPVAPVAAGYPVSSVSATTASWGQLGSPFGSSGGLALRDTACRVAVQLTMSSSFGPLQQVYVLKNVNLPVDQDPYAAYGLVRNGETTVLSLGVIPLNSTTIGLYLPADNGTLWPVPQSSGAIQSITVGPTCSPTGVGAAAVFWYAAARRRSRRALAAADDAAPLSSAQLAASFEAGLSSALGLPPGAVSVTVTELPSLSSPAIRALYAVYLDLPGTVQEPFSAGFDDGLGQPLPAAVAAALGELTGKPVTPAAIAAGELSPVDADGFPTYWASSDGSEPDPSARQISVHVTIPSKLLALPRSQWPEALQAAIPAGSSDSGAAIAAALSSPRVSAALAAQGLPASAVTLPSSTGSSGGGQGAWSAPVTAGAAPAGPSSSTDGGASSGGSSSSGGDSAAAPAAGLVAGAAIGAAAAVALASGLIVLAVRRAAAPRVAANKLPAAEGSSSSSGSPGRSVSQAGSSDPAVAELDPVSRCETSGDATEAPPRSSAADPPALAAEPLTHIVTGSLSPTSGRFTVTSAGAFRATAAAVPLPDSMGPGGGAALADALAAAGAGDDGGAAATSSRRAAVVPLPVPGSADTPDSDAFMPEAAPGDLDGAAPNDGHTARLELHQGRRILEEDAAPVDPSPLGATPTSLLFTRSFKAPGTGALAASAAAAGAWAIADLDGPAATASLPTGDSDSTESDAAALAAHPLAVPPSAAEEEAAAGAAASAPRMLLSHAANHPSTPSRKATATPRSPELARF